MPSLVSKKSSSKSESHKLEPVASEPTAMPNASEAPAPSLIFEYVLFNPELYDDFTDLLIIDGKEYRRTHENNLCVTREKVLADYLVKKGYQILETKEI